MKSAMNSYVTFLRGINVGGKALIKMSDLRDALTAAGLSDVRTYIQSGNVLFSSGVNDKKALASSLNAAIRDAFGLDVDVALFTATEWRRIIEAAPDWWGADQSWKHNLLIAIEPYGAKDVMAAAGELKPEIEAMQPGKGVVYQSLSKAQFGRTTASRLISSPVYKKLTIRNYNTARKLQSLLAAT